MKNTFESYMKEPYVLDFCEMQRLLQSNYTMNSLTLLQDMRQSELNGECCPEKRKWIPIL